MKHFTTAEWIDFVNQVTSQKQQAAMQKHLGTGCKGCEEAVALWQKIRNTAVLEASYQPPAAHFRIIAGISSVRSPISLASSAAKSKTVATWNFLSPARAKNLS